MCVAHQHCSTASTAAASTDTVCMSGPLAVCWSVCLSLFLFSSLCGVSSVLLFQHQYVTNTQTHAFVFNSLFLFVYFSSTETPILHKQLCFTTLNVPPMMNSENTYNYEYTAAQIMVISFNCYPIYYDLISLLSNFIMISLLSKMMMDPFLNQTSDRQTLQGQYHWPPAVTPPPGERSILQHHYTTA